MKDQLTSRSERAGRLEKQFLVSPVINAVDLQLLNQLDAKGLKRKRGRPSKEGKEILQRVEAQNRYGLRSNVESN